MPFHKGAIFHPKVWAIRFTDQGGNRIHRVIILSRNMTLDRSWDTALVLDEEDDGAIDAAPAADFVRRLPTLALPGLSAGRAAEIEGLASSLSTVRLAAPSPFTAGELLPIGMTDDRVWPFPDKGKRLLAISPFLSKPAISAISTIAADRTVVSRAESLELVGSKLLAGWSVNVLQRLAETDPGTDLDDISAPTPDRVPGISRGPARQDVRHRPRRRPVNDRDRKRQPHERDMGHQRRVRRGPYRPDLNLRSRGNAQRITRSTGAQPHPGGVLHH